MKVVLVILGLFGLSVSVGMADDASLLQNFRLPAEELNAVLPFYRALADGDMNSAMQYVKEPPENFVGALKSISEGLSPRLSAKSFVSVSWKSYPQWEENPHIWAVIGFYESEHPQMQTSEAEYPQVFTDVWVKSAEGWRMVPEDFVYGSVDVYYSNYLEMMSRE